MLWRCYRCMSSSALRWPLQQPGVIIPRLHRLYRTRLLTRLRRHTLRAGIVAAGPGRLLCQLLLARTCHLPHAVWHSLSHAVPCRLSHSTCSMSLLIQFVTCRLSLVTFAATWIERDVALGYARWIKHATSAVLVLLISIIFVGDSVASWYLAATAVGGRCCVTRSLTLVQNSLFVAPAGVNSGLHVDAFASHFWMALFQVFPPPPPPTSGVNLCPLAVSQQRNSGLAAKWLCLP